MKYIYLLLIAIILNGCTTPDDCDKRIKNLLPDEIINTQNILIPSALKIYLVSDEKKDSKISVYVCYFNNARLSIKRIKFKKIQ